VKDGRHLSRRLEADLLAAGEELVRVPPKMMAHARDAARTYGKSDPIDALAVARAALREPGLPVARLGGPSRELQLLVDHREDLVRQRTAHINRLRWHLHELDPSWDPAPRSLVRFKHLDALAGRLAAIDGMVARIARDLVARVRELTAQANALQREIEAMTKLLAPALLEIPGVAELTAAKILAETADVRRFRSKDAFARHGRDRPAAGVVLEPGTAPAVSNRQPPAERRHPSHRRHPEAVSSTGDRLPRAPHDERQHQEGGSSSVEAKAV
jgi:transposase